MFKSKNLMMLITLLILVAAAVSTVIAADGSGSANFTVTNAIFVAGNEIKPGSYDVKWQATGSDATVVFVNKGKEVAKIPAKVVEVDKKGDYNSLAIGKDSTGREAIKGMQFAGKKVRLVFD